jgi:hypothetical protein
MFLNDLGLFILGDGKMIRAITRRTATPATTTPAGL